MIQASQEFPLRARYEREGLQEVNFLRRISPYEREQNDKLYCYIHLHLANSDCIDVFWLVLIFLNWSHYSIYFLTSLLSPSSLAIRKHDLARLSDLLQIAFCTQSSRIVLHT